MSSRGRWQRPVWSAWAWLACLVVLTGLGLRPARAQDLLPVPTLTARVLDSANALTPTQRGALERKLEALQRDTGTQAVVILVPSTQPEDIADYTQRLGDAWRIGRRDVGDGLLIVVAVQDRRVRIAPAKTLEGAIPDLAARQIIDRQLAPAFRAGDYAGGLNAAVDALAQRIRGEGLPAPEATSGTRHGADAGSGWEDLAIFFFVGVPIFGAVLTGIFGRKLGALATGGVAGGIGWGLTNSALLAGAAGVVALVLVGVLGFGASQRRTGGGSGLRRSGPRVGGPVIFPGGGWSGGSSGGSWGGGDSGGGGFSSGGGGDFGGGGASGDW